MVASGVFAGAFTRDWAVAREDREGVTFGAALDSIGYRGPESCGRHPLSAFFELHIEQGPILEAEEKEVGIVTGVQGMRWYEVTVTGESAHTGATPMRLRKNALLGAARLVERINAIAERHKPDALGAVGLMEVRPNSRNVVPGEVRFSVDLRHISDAKLDAMEAMLGEACARLGRESGLTFDVQLATSYPTVQFHPDCVSAVRKATQSLGYKHIDIVSGAGHDACYINRVAPTAMIFVPCEGGISHNEIENAKPEDLAAGCDVLLSAIVERAAS